MKLIDNNSNVFPPLMLWCLLSLDTARYYDDHHIIIDLNQRSVSGVQDAVVECCTEPSTRTHSHSCCSTVTQPSQQHWLLYSHKEAGLWRWSNQNFNQGLISVRVEGCGTRWISIQSWLKYVMYAGINWSNELVKYIHRTMCYAGRSKPGRCILKSYWSYHVHYIAFMLFY